MGLITTIEARCKDCYKCVRSCPVKAIRIRSGHAEVVHERCILDGRCTVICPQRAKKVESDLGRVKEFLSSGRKVVAGLAPSFITVTGMITPGKLVSALTALGFWRVQETALAAEFVAREHARLICEGRRPLISSSCPAIINLVERHYPEFIPYLAPVASPMVVQGRLVKWALGRDVVFVFIGPCIAKKEEARDKHVRGAVDAVLTFDELYGWMEEAGIDAGALPESPFWPGPRWLRDMLVRGDTRAGGPGLGRFFPVAGGLAGTAGMDAGLLARDVITISGIEQCLSYLSRFPREDEPALVEALACEGGCLDGPGLREAALKAGQDLFARRERLLSYAEQEAPYGNDAPAGVSSLSAGPRDEPHDRDNDRDVDSKAPSGMPPGVLPLRRAYSSKKVSLPQPGEEDIRRILEATGKFTGEDELNCGACGYDSCREKAVAVFQGMAEVEMCIPYMRKRAESMAQATFAFAPNGIIIVDKNLAILDVNPVIERKFLMRKEAVKGRNLEDLLDARVFKEAVAKGGIATGEVSYPAYGIVTSQTVVYVSEEDMAIGILADITEEKAREERLSKMREETLTSAQDVIARQMRVAQEIAGLLGETTAETKLVLTRLMELMRQDGGGRG
ncbi:MAG TPA: hypothetical protein GX506_03770 [Firmicutes bacterium]|nr:hypothetical protein [Bacillota bacterium]